MAYEHDPVIEAADLLDKFVYGCGHIKGEPDDIHRTTNLYCAGFWFLGVNLRLQSLQYRIFLIPAFLVILLPLLVVFVDPHNVALPVMLRLGSRSILYHLLRAC